MKRSLYLTLSALLVFTTVTGCSDDTPKAKKAAKPAYSTQAMSAAAEHTGTVVETINTAGYTYVQVDTGSEKIWAAAPEFQIKMGDKVTFPRGMLMKNHSSKTLNRTFDSIYFVDSIMLADTGQDAGQPPKQKPVVTRKRTAVTAPADMNFSGIETPEGGKTIAELYAKRDELSGKEVIVRGKVVKFSPKIMGKNWIHLQDGTGNNGAKDLTITTSSVAKVGDTVVASGVVVTNKDLGYGYKYDVIIEDAKIKVE